MRYLLLILSLIIATSINAQIIYTTSFSDFSPNTSLFDVAYNFDVTLKDSIGDDIVGSTDANGHNFGADFEDESIASSNIIDGGKFIDFNGTTHYFDISNGSNNAFKPAADADWTFAASINVADASGWGSVILGFGNNTYFRASNFSNNGAGFYSQIYDGTHYHREGKDGVVFSQGFNTFVVTWTEGDTVRYYINGVQSTGNGSQNNGTFADVDAPHPSADTNIGQLDNGTQKFDERISYLAFNNSVALTAKQIKEFCYLASGWKSGGGNVTRLNWGFHQGISGSGLTIKSKVGGSGTTFTYTPNLTADSSRFTYQSGTAHTFSGDSLLLMTDTDSVWHSVPDTVLGSAFGLQVVLDAWETGGAVYVDNITVSGYTLPVSATATGKFKGNFEGFSKDWVGFGR